MTAARTRLREPVTEGAFLDGVHVLTPAELEQVVYRETRAFVRELRRLRDLLRRHDVDVKKPPRARTYVPYVPATPFALERRRETYRAAAAKRRERYLLLCERLGETVDSSNRWYRHLADLDRRAA